jgi:hypothetical protein
VERLLRTLHSGNWGRLQGTEVSEFEQRFAALHGCAHGIAVANGTVALRVALLLWNSRDAGFRKISRLSLPTQESGVDHVDGFQHGGKSGLHKDHGGRSVESGGQTRRVFFSCLRGLRALRVKPLRV